MSFSFVERGTGDWDVLVDGGRICRIRSHTTDTGEQVWLSWDSGKRDNLRFRTVSAAMAYCCDWLQGGQQWR